MSQQKDHKANSLSIEPHQETGIALRESTADAVTLDVQPAHAEGRRGSFNVTIVNGMPRPAAVTLTACDDEASWLRVAIEPASPIVVPAHGAARATVSVAPARARTTPKGAVCDLDVRALYPAHPGPYLAQVSGHARFTYTPDGTPPQRARWLPVSIVSLLLICGIVVYAAMPKASSGPAEPHRNTPSRQPAHSGAASTTPRAPAPTSAARSQARPSPATSGSGAGRSRGQSRGTQGARPTGVFAMTVSSTLRSQPRDDSGRSVLVFKGQHVTDLGVWTPHWQYVDFRGHRGWVLKAHLSGLP